MQRNAGASSAECSADGELARAVRCAGGIETSEIDAGGDEDERGKEHERGEEAAERSAEVGPDEAEGHGAEGGVELVLGKFTRDILRDTIEVSLRLSDGDAGEAAAHDPDVLIVAIVEEAVALDLLLIP